MKLLRKLPSSHRRVAAGRVIHRLSSDRQLHFALAPQGLTRKIKEGEDVVLQMDGFAVGEAEQDDVFSDDIKLPAADGYPLAATLFLPRRSKRKQAILINSAAAVSRKIYRGFASYLAGRGCAVLIYDYRGIGGSKPKSLVGFPANMSDWAKLDATAAIDWMRLRYKELPLNVVGHAFGGQAVGLLANNTEIQRTLMVSAQAGYWKLYPSPERYRVHAILKYIGSPLAHAMGYVPHRLGLGGDMPKEDMPKNVFLQWVSWVMNPRYFFTDEKLEGRGNFEKYRGELRAICIADDPWATRSAVKMLCSGFTAIEPEIIDIQPKENNAGQIGHFGFFRPQHRATLWRKAGDWLTGEEEVVPVPAVDLVPAKVAAETIATIESPASDAVTISSAADALSAAQPANTETPTKTREEKTLEAESIEVKADLKATIAVETNDVESLLARFHALKIGRPDNYSAASRT